MILGTAELWESSQEGNCFCASDFQFHYPGYARKQEKAGGTRGPTPLAVSPPSLHLLENSDSSQHLPSLGLKIPPYSGVSYGRS